MKHHTKQTAYLSIGSNIGDRRKNILNAINILNKNDIKVLKTSSYFETKPFNSRNQKNFYNCVLKIETNLSPLKLLSECERIEKEMGRINKGDKLARIIDIDILLFGKKIIKNSTLTIPHKEMHKRIFALYPLCEIAPRIVHPKIRKTIKSLLEEFTNEEIARNIIK